MRKLIENPMRFSRMISLASLFAGLALGVAVPMFAQSNAPDPTPPAGTQKAGAGSPDEQAPALGPKTEPAAAASPEAIRQARIEEDTKKLFRLSAEMRAEVAKTYKETLSLTVLKKAEEIEKLAKSLKALMNREASTVKPEDQPEDH